MGSQQLCLGLLTCLALSFASLSAEPARAESTINRVRVKKAIADSMTPAELAAYKARLAERIERGVFDHPRPAPGPVPITTPADSCPAATPEIVILPWNSGPDTTVGSTDNYDLATATVSPTCSAPGSCTGAGPVASLPRGAIYTGTGTAPDRAYRILVNNNCTLTITATPLANWDLALVVYREMCTNKLAHCLCVDDTGTFGQAESVTLNAVAGTSYYAVIDGYSSGGTPPGPSGPFDLRITGVGCTPLLQDPSAGR